MKKNFAKLVAVLAIVVGSVLSSNAQEVGIRFGGINGNTSGAIDAVFGLGQFSRIHADLAFHNGGIGVEALWDFLNKPLSGEAFTWYLGVGPSLDIHDDFWLGVSGEIGLEYHFTGAPIAIGLDWRPTFWIIEETKFGADSFGLNVRYVFGK